MKSDPQARILARERDGFFESRFVEHQTGGRENPFAVGPDDRVVCAGIESKVIRVDYEQAFPAMGPRNALRGPRRRGRWNFDRCHGQAGWLGSGATVFTMR